MQPYSQRIRPDGVQEISSRCACDVDPRTGEARTVYEERLLLDPASGQALGLHVRFGGVWFDPNDLIRASRLQSCFDCQGVAPGPGMPVCHICGGLGVLSPDGGRVTAPQAVRVS